MIKRQLLSQLTLLLVLSFALYSCVGKKKDGARIEGKILNAPHKMVYLEQITGHEMPPIDSARLDKDGNFEFLRKIRDFEYLKVTVPGIGAIQLVVDSAEDVNISADAAQLDNYTVTGSKNSELLHQLNDSLKSYSSGTREINETYNSYSQQPGYNMDSLQAILQKRYNNVVDQRADFSKHFIRSHLNSIVSLSVTQFVDINRDFEYYQVVDSALFHLYPNNQYVKEFHSNIQNLVKRLPKGSPAPELSGKTLQGKELSLASLKAHFVVVDFWASWCKPCRAELPDLIKVYQKYHSKGLEIFSFSLDRDKSAWEKAVKDEKISWPQVSDLMEWKSPVLKTWYVESIPYMVLLDNEGHILAKGLTAEDLDKKLEALTGGAGI